MKYLYIFLVLIIPEICLATIIASGDDCAASSTDTCHWELDDSGEMIISGNGAIKDYSVAQHPTENRVQTTAPWKDFDRNISSLVISEGITGVGRFAFYYAKNLSNIQFPSSFQSIGYQAFDTSSLTSLRIPDTIKNIEDGAFRYSTQLKNIEISDGVISIGNRAFEYCIQLENIVIGDNVKFIGENAFLQINPNAKIYCQDTSAHTCHNLINENTRGNDKLSMYQKKGGYYILDGMKYRTLDDMLKKSPIKRIYTVDEANRVSGKKNSFKIRYK